MILIAIDVMSKVYSVKYKDFESHDIQYQHHIRCHKLLGEVMVIIMFCVCSNIYIDMLSRKKCMCNRMKRICTFELYIILPFRLLLPFTYNINCVSVFGNIGNDWQRYKHSLQWNLAGNISNVIDLLKPETT